jgi:hypothetical protein
MGVSNKDTSSQNQKEIVQSDQRDALSAANHGNIPRLRDTKIPTRLKVSLG